MKRNKIAIIGAGIVGAAIEEALSYEYEKGYDIEIWMVDEAWGEVPDEYITTTKAKLDGVIIAVPTDRVVEAVNTWAPLAKHVLIKSAIQVPTLRLMKQTHDNITMGPEFLSGHTARSAVESFKEQKMLILGGASPRFWANLLKPAMPAVKDIRIVSDEQACFLKLAENSFLAAKVSFFNQLFNIYEGLGCDGFDEMVDALCLDERIGNSHNEVPGPDGEFGYGGPCLPKDIDLLRQDGESQGVDVSILTSIIDYNESVRKL